MDTIIGLFPYQQDGFYLLQQLVDAGIDVNKIRVFTQEKPIQKLFGSEPKRMAVRYAIWGTLFGIAVYGIFGLIAGWCECNLFYFSQLIAIKTILIGILVGAIIGGLLGGITDIAENEKDTHLYTQGVRMGDTVFVIRTELDEIENANSSLHQNGLYWCKDNPR